MSSLSSKNSTTFGSLDMLRGAAAFAVFVYHFHSLFQEKAAAPAVLGLIGAAGHVGLDVFFVLSGFLIFRSLYLHGVNGQYFVRRFLRIMPIYYFSLAIVLLFVDQSYLFSAEGWRNIASHLFFLQSFSSATYYGINPVLWSLSIELIFYLFLPIFLLLAGKSGKRIVGGIVLMLLACYFYRYKIMIYYPNWDSTQRIIFTENFIGRLDQFAFGMLASFTTIKLGMMEQASSAIRKHLLPILSLGAVIGGTLGLFWGMKVFAQLAGGFRDVVFYQVFLHSLVGFFAALVIFGLSNTYRWVSLILGNKVFAFMGMISYSFYIWHIILIDQVKKLSGQPLVAGNEFVISFVVTLLFSTLTYYFVEKSFLAKKVYSPVKAG